MPINAKPAYFVAEAEYHEAETTDQKIRALKKMLSTAPTHKGAEKLRAQIKKKLRDIKYRKEIEKKVGKGKSYSISKEGAAQVVLIGLSNSGKSTLLSKLSGKKVRVEPYKFSTKSPEVKMMPYENVWIQGIELPAFYRGYHKSKRGRQMLGILRNSDFVIVVMKDKRKFKEYSIIEHELGEAGIKLGSMRKYREGLVEYIPSMVVDWRDFDKKKLVESIWKRQKKIRILTRTNGKIASKPIVMRKGATVGDAAKIIHKDFVKNFRYAKIYGPSAKFDGQQVGLDHKLKDGDVIEIFTK